MPPTKYKIVKNNNISFKEYPILYNSTEEKTGFISELSLDNNDKRHIVKMINREEAKEINFPEYEFKKAKTLKEAEIFSKQQGIKADFTGMDLDMVNGFNEGVVKAKTIFHRYIFSVLENEIEPFLGSDPSVDRVLKYGECELLIKNGKGKKNIIRIANWNKKDFELNIKAGYKIGDFRLRTFIMRHIMK